MASRAHPGRHNVSPQRLPVVPAAPAEADAPPANSDPAVKADSTEAT